RLPSTPSTGPATRAEVSPGAGAIWPDRVTVRSCEDRVMATTVDRLLPDDESRALLDLAREIAEKELAPRAAEAEAKAEFPADAYRVLGKAGLLSLPFEEGCGGGGGAAGNDP